MRPPYIDDEMGFLEMTRRVGRAVKARREHLALNQLQFVKRTRLSYPAMLRLEAQAESSEVVNFTMRLLWQVAYALEIPLAKLFEEPEKPKPTEHGLLPGTPQYRLVELAKKLPPGQATTLVRYAERMIEQYYDSLKLQAPTFVTQGLPL